MSRQSATEKVQSIMRFRLDEIKKAAEQIQDCPACGGSGATGTWGNYTLCPACNGQRFTIKN
jgi:DnaJ-class molecular chaperone